MKNWQKQGYKTKEKYLSSKKRYYKKNKNKWKIYYENNKDKILYKIKEWYLLNKKYSLRYAKKYRFKHKNLIKKWKIDNKEKINQTACKWRRNNKEKLREQYRLHRRKNPLLYRTYYINRRIKDKDRRIYISRKVIQQIYENNIKKFKTLTCYLCLKPIVFGDDCLEHKTPLSRGGTNKYENLGIAHRDCNSRKHNKTLKEWQTYNGRN